MISISMEKLRENLWKGILKSCETLYQSIEKKLISHYLYIFPTNTQSVCHNVCVLSIGTDISLRDTKSIFTPSYIFKVYIDSFLSVTCYHTKVSVKINLLLRVWHKRFLVKLNLLKRKLAQKFWLSDFLYSFNDSFNVSFV